MRLLFDDDLVEGVVSLWASGRRAGVPALQVHRFHMERERCYAVPDPEDRSAAFARVQLAWFNEWGMAQRLRSVTAHFPRLAAALVTLAFRKARGRNDEGAELYQHADGTRRGVVALKPGRLAVDADLERYLHHELAHLADLVDDAFGYSPEPARAGQTASQLRLVRERYRLLWNISVDGRLTGRGLPTIADEAGRRRDFHHGFAFLGEGRREQIFADLWNGRIARHDDLLALACDPRDLQQHQGAVPGAPCPLCGFAAFQWADPARLQPEVRARILAEFPEWREAESVCGRCAEIYQSISGLQYPATVCVSTG